MPPKQRKQKGSAEEDDVFTLEAEGRAAGEGKKEEQVNLWDTPSLKRALDQAIIEAVTDKGLPVDHTYTDIKIVLGLLACGMALLAQFYPQKYPANFWLLICCVATYMLLSTLMTVVAMVFEKDAILLTKAQSGPAGGLPPLAVSTKLPRFHDSFTLSIAPRSTTAAAGSGGGRSGGVSITKSVGAYFHSDGYLAKEVIRADTAQLLEKLIEAKNK